MALPAWILLFIAAFGLAAHCAACALVALRRFWRCRLRRGAPAPGVSLLCPLAAAGAEEAQAQRQILNAAFAVNYQPKEIIFCAADLAAADLRAVRAAREANAAAPSLLINLPAAEGGPANGAGGLAAALAKGFKAARYDRVAIAPLNLPLPNDYLTRFISRENRGAKTGGGQAALICAPLWAAGSRGAKVQLRAAFLNDWRGRRLCLADSLGCGMAAFAEPAASAAAGQAVPALAMSAALISYEAVIRAGGIEAVMRRAAAEGFAAAAAELARGQSAAICLTARPLAVAAGAPAAAESAPAAALGWLRACRRFLPRLFWAELLLSPLAPFLACAGACAAGLLPLPVLPIFIAVWYGAELLCCALWGRGGSWRGCLFWPLRDILLPVLWLRAACGRPVRRRAAGLSPHNISENHFI